MFCLYYVLVRICVFWTQNPEKGVTLDHVTHFDQYAWIVKHVTTMVTPLVHH